MKARILYILLLFVYLNASEELSSKTLLESLVFKAGITALINDFEREKNITKQHSIDIEELKQNVKFLMEQSLNNKLATDNRVDNVSINGATQVQIDSLQEENKKLKALITQLQKAIPRKKVENFLSTNVKVVVKESTLRAKPDANANIIANVFYGDMLKIERCNKYGWCKIVNKDAYIPKYKIRFIPR